MLALGGALAWVALAGGVQQYETYEVAVAASAPAAQFRFDDAAGSPTLADSAGSYSASNTGITLGGEGPFGGSKSGSFGGKALATLPSDPLKEASAFTAEAWVNWAGGASYGQPIFDFGSGSSNYMYLTPSSTASKHPMLFEIHAGSGTATVTTTKLRAKAWEYVAVTETSAGKITLYLKGEPVAELAKATVTPASLGASPPEDYLGAGPLASSEPKFSGSLSNVAFYTKALTSGEVKEHFDDAEFPVNASPPTISGTAKDGKTLTAKEGSWIGLPLEKVEFHWELCNGTGEGCLPIPGATSSTYLLGHGDVENTLRVAVKAENKAGTGSATSAHTAVVAAIKLSNLTLPVISGTAKVGQELAVSEGTWEGSPPTHYKYAWETCNSSGEKCKGNGGVASVYEPTATQASEKNTLRAIVTAENSAGPASATSAATAIITPGPPRDKTPPVISGPVTEGGKLTASRGVWAGTEPIEYKYEWRRCSHGSCSPVATGLSYEPSS
ncbi:MAG TPA: LamG domain-containing protein, partial [Solirubrobacteraceae bacterium]|nr:LamG domain-containing protein [Solirubrobacteraceae bacterium]